MDEASPSVPRAEARSLRFWVNGWRMKMTRISPGPTIKHRDAILFPGGQVAVESVGSVSVYPTFQDFILNHKANQTSVFFIDGPPMDYPLDKDGVGAVRRLEASFVDGLDGSLHPCPACKTEKESSGSSYVRRPDGTWEALCMSCFEKSARYRGETVPAA